MAGKIRLNLRFPRTGSSQRPDWRAADVVRSHAAPGDTLCAGDIGVLGYRTGLRILDTVGLVTPESTRHYPADPAIYVINYAIPAGLMADLYPAVEGPLRA